MPNQIGKYKIKSQLGKGASGAVYLAADTFSNTDIALKVIDLAVFEEAEFGPILLTQFLNEASLAGKLHHPHIVSILDAAVTDDTGYIAMEYVPGGNLLKHTQAGNLLPVEDVIQIGFKCSSALDYAFREGIVHRDIKPENILIVKNTEIKIADFGAIHLHKEGEPQTANIGTPTYMSPEQISHELLTQQSDMYCLGVMLYQLLTGQRPFVAKNLPELLEKILQEEPAAPSSIRTELPAELDAVILTALKKNPKDRYPGWDEFALALAKIGKLSIYQQTIPDSEKYEALRQAEMLNQFNDAEIWELVQAGRWKRMAPQSLIIREDTPGQTIFFLAQGRVKASKKGHLLDIIGTGEYFGEMSYIRSGDMPRQATIEAVTDVVIAEFDNIELTNMSDSCQHHLARAILRTLVDRLALANVRMSRVTS